MSDLKSPDEAVFFLSCLYNEDIWSEERLLSFLRSSFGEFSTYKNNYFPMKNYYSKEMGNNLSRIFVFLSGQSPLEKLVDLKTQCDSLERQHATQDKRSLNIDPGYISSSQMLLATGKPYSHRIYLRNGVYAELCYQFEAKSFKKLPWTYPDYCSDEVIQAFNIIREFNFYKKNL